MKCFSFLKKEVEEGGADDRLTGIRAEAEAGLGPGMGTVEA